MNKMGAALDEETYEKLKRGLTEIFERHLERDEELEDWDTTSSGLGGAVAVRAAEVLLKLQDYKP